MVYIISALFLLFIFLPFISSRFRKSKFRVISKSFIGKSSKPNLFEAKELTLNEYLALKSIKRNMDYHIER